MSNQEESASKISQAIQEMQGGFGDWSILGFFDDMGQARADYVWYKKCEAMPLDQLQDLVDDGVLGKDSETGELIVADDEMDALIVAFYEKRHNQATVVLEARGEK